MCIRDRKKARVEIWLMIFSLAAKRTMNSWRKRKTEDTRCTASTCPAILIQGRSYGRQVSCSISFITPESKQTKLRQPDCDLSGRAFASTCIRSCGRVCMASLYFSALIAITSIDAESVAACSFGRLGSLTWTLRSVFQHVERTAEDEAQRKAYLEYSKMPRLGLAVNLLRTVKSLWGSSLIHPICCCRLQAHDLLTDEPIISAVPMWTSSYACTSCSSMQAAYEQLHGMWNARTTPSYT